LFPLISLLAGFSVALAARQQIQRGATLWREPYLPGLLLFELLVLVPVGIYLFVVHPAWATLYLMSANEVTTGVVAWILAGCLVVAAMGYLGGYFMCLYRQSRILVILSGLTVLGMLLLFVLAGDRLSHLSETEAFHDAPGLLASNLGIMFAFIIPVVLGGWIFLVVLFGMEGHKMLRARIGTVRADSGSHPALGATSAYPSNLASSERRLSPSELSPTSASSPSRENGERSPVREVPVQSDKVEGAGE
jgi:hypothetical protein